MASWTAIDWSRHVRDATVGGRRLRYVDYGDGPPLVLLHGLGGAWQWWLECLPALGERHRVIAVDLPGFGHSDALPEPAEMAEHAAAVAELLDQLDTGPVAVGGHSMGGLVALALAREFPDHVRTVVLVNAGGVPMTALRLAVVMAVMRASFLLLSRPAVLEAIATRSWLRRQLLPGATRASKPLSPELAAEIVPLLPAAGFVTAVAAAGRAVASTEPERVTQPVGLIWGDRDPIVGVAHARDMERRLPDARLALIEGVSHSPMIEAPDELVRHVLEFAA